MSDQEKISKILNILENIDMRLSVIESHIGIVKTDCSKMSQHINFVENTYKSLRVPLNFMKKQVEYIMGTGNNATLTLPEIKK